MNNSLSDRMKQYESVTKTFLISRMPVIIRIDGRAFHSFTRGFNKPFDDTFIKLMQKTTLDLCKDIQNCILGYVQSDEISLLLVDYYDINTSTWFNNQVQKLTAISASLATMYFNKHLYEACKLFENSEKLKDKVFTASFDSRAFNIPKDEVCNYFIWRQKDATRNSINSLAQSMFLQKEIEGVTSKDLQNKMLLEKDVNWNSLSIVKKRGTCCVKIKEGWIIDEEIPIFTEDRNYIEKFVF